MSARLARPASKAPSRPFLIGIGLAVLATALTMLYIGYNAPQGIPGRSYYLIEAEFRDADNLAPHYQVRMGGRLIGQVVDLRVHDGRALVTLQLDRAIAPLRSDTRLQVRPRSAIGIRFVEVTPGERGRPLSDGATIPIGQTSSTVPIDEALSMLTPRRREHARVLLNELGAGVAGRGDGLNDTLRRAPRFLESTSAVTSAITARDGAMSRLITSSRGAAAAADPVRADIAGAFDNGARAVRPFAQRDVALAGTLDAAPPALAAIDSGLPAADRMLDELGGLARGARTTLRRAPRALAATDAMLATARPGLRQVERTLALAGDAVPPLLDLLETADPALPGITAALRDSLPNLAALGAHACDWQLTWENWGTSVSAGNAGGNYLRLNFVPPSREALGGAGGSDPNVFSNAYPAPCTAATEELPK